MSGNYGFLIDAARRLSPSPSPRVLDFGCGVGELVRVGLAQGVDIEGVDTFTDWHEEHRLAPDVRDRLHKIDGQLPFPDSSFDVVVSNQVFEHVADPPAVLPEIRRVLRPGGAFVAIFPLRETWYEGHVGLYFAHWLRSTALLERYLSFAHRLGFGLHREQAEWAAYHAKALRTACHYHRGRDVRRWWQETFGEPPVSLAPDYVAYRLGHRFGPLSHTVAHARVGTVLAVQNRKSPVSRN